MALNRHDILHRVVLASVTRGALYVFTDDGLPRLLRSRASWCCGNTLVLLLEGTLL